MTWSSDLTEGYQVEVAQVSVCDESATTSRSAHCRYKLHICHGPEAVVPPIPATHVHELPQQLNWGLHQHKSFTLIDHFAAAKA